MSNCFTICIDVEVCDEQELYEAALKYAINVDGSSREDAISHLTYEEGEFEEGDSNINISACLQMLADPGISYPGTSILQSYVES